MLQSGRRLDGLQDWGNKLVGQTLRIAGLLHVAETDEMESRISPETLRRAIRLGRAFISHTRAAYNLLNANEKTRLARYVWRRICEDAGLPGVPNIPSNPKKAEGPLSGDTGDYGDAPSITKRDLWQATKSKSDIDEVKNLNAPLRQLEEHHLIQVVKQEQEGPGRNPSP